MSQQRSITKTRLANSRKSKLPTSTKSSPVSSSGDDELANRHAAELLTDAQLSFGVGIKCPQVPSDPEERRV